MTFQEFKAFYLQRAPEHFPTEVPSKPLVSVCVQTFNHEKYIGKCLDSILNQKTNFPFEILVGEDESSDGTRKICKEYAEKHPDKIRLFLHHSENKIRLNNLVTGNFNALYNFYQSRGKFIAFCEGDDYWTDIGKLQKQKDILQRDPNLIFSFHSFIIKNSTGNSSLKDLTQPRKNLSSEELVNLNEHPLLSTICFRKAFSQLPYEISMVINMDSFLISYLGNLGSAIYQPEIKPNIYRRHSGGIWSGNEREKSLLLKANTFRMISQYYQRNENPSATKKFRLYTKQTYRSILIKLLKKGELKTAIKYLAKIF